MFRVSSQIYYAFSRLSQPQGFLGVQGNPHGHFAALTRAVAVGLHGLLKVMHVIWILGFLQGFARFHHPRGFALCPQRFADGHALAVPPMAPRPGYQMLRTPCYWCRPARRAEQERPLAGWLSVCAACSLWSAAGAGGRELDVLAVLLRGGDVGRRRHQRPVLDARQRGQPPLAGMHRWSCGMTFKWPTEVATCMLRFNLQLNLPFLHCLLALSCAVPPDRAIVICILQM